MRFALQASSLAPRGFVVEGVSNNLVGTVIAVRPAGKTANARDAEQFLLGSTVGIDVG